MLKLGLGAWWRLQFSDHELSDEEYHALAVLLIAAMSAAAILIATFATW